MPEGKKKQPKKRKRVIKWTTVILVVGSAAMIISSLFTAYTATKPASATMEWNTFEKYLSEDKIDYVEIIRSENTFTVITNDGERYTCINPGHETFKKEILEAGVEIKISNKDLVSSITSIIMTLPMNILLLVFIFFLMKSLGGQVTTLYKVYKPEDIIKFDQVAGMSDTKKEVMFAVSQLKNSEKLNKLGAKPCTGIILEGPPGTGKTLLAKAIAGEANVPFISVCGADFIEMFVGLGAARVRKLWELAQLNAPCVLFIDEIDAVGKRRGSGSDGASTEANQTLNALLQKMDGLEGNAGIFVIGATNRIEDLDPALLRPGRFDKRLFVGPPRTKEDREEIIQLYVKNKKLSADCDINKISKLLFGFSGAEIEQVLNEAVLISVQKEKDGIITIEDIDEAAMKQRVYGVSTRHTSNEDIMISAIHEAGHAVISSALGRKVSKVSIMPYSSGVGGITIQDTDEFEGKMMKTKEELAIEIEILLAGREAEKVVTGTTSNGCSNDIERATIIANRMIYEFAMTDYCSINPGALKENGVAIIDNKERLEVVNAFVKKYAKTVNNLVEQHRDDIIKLKDQLIEEETVIDYRIGS